MKNKLAIVALLIVSPIGVAMAESNVGCGVGTMIFEGQKGVPQEVLAATTNGILGNQTFGISSGTLGCARDSVIKSPVKVSMFIDTNLDKLAYDMAVGQGETLDSLANLIGMDDAHKATFFRVAKSHYAEIISSEYASTEDVVAALNRVLGEDSDLSQYANLI